jgi:mRNA interferase MazF
VVIGQGEVWWTDFGVPIGSAPGYLRPSVVVQCDAMNSSNISTVVVVPLTTNARWARVPGNVTLSARATGLDRESVANVSQVVAVDKSLLTERVGQVSRQQVERIHSGIDIVLGR